jgi:hypothetical protein
MNQFNLDAKLKLEIEIGENVFTHLVRQPNLEDLKALELYLPDNISTNFKGEIQTTDLTQKRNIQLWEMCIIEVTGYEGLETGNPNWKKKIPVIHQNLVANELTKVKAITETDVKTHFGTDQVKKCSYEYVPVYTAADQGGITLLQTHVFQQPTEEDLNIYTRNTSTSYKMKNNRINMKSKPQAVNLCSLYDKLISETHGYTSTATEKPGEITAHIPPLHKINAIRALFNMLNEEIKTQQGNS